MSAKDYGSSSSSSKDTKDVYQAPKAAETLKVAEALKAAVEALKAATAVGAKQECPNCNDTKLVECTCLNGVQILSTGRLRKCRFCLGTRKTRCVICTKCPTCNDTRRAECRFYGCLDGFVLCSTCGLDHNNQRSPDSDVGLGLGPRSRIGTCNRWNIPATICPLCKGARLECPDC